MEQIKVLFGFSDESFEEAVKALLKQKGYDAEIFARFNKDSVKQFIEKNPDTAAVVLLEAFPRQSRGTKPQKYTAEEVAQLTESSDVNVILVLSENYKGTEYMKTLFAAGITSAFLQKRGEGARPRDIASLILQKRTRKMAREYYGIGGGRIDLGFLEREDFTSLYEKMHEKDNLLAGYLAVCGSLNATQIADFTRRLPEDDRDYLTGFEEFHTIIALLKKFGIDLHIKRPRKVVIGLNRQMAITMVDNHVVFDTAEKEEEKEEVSPEEEKEVVSDKQEAEEEKVKEPVPESEPEPEPVPKPDEEIKEEEKELSFDEMDLESLIAFATGNKTVNVPSVEKEPDVTDKLKAEPAKDEEHTGDGNSLPKEIETEQPAPKEEKSDAEETATVEEEQEIPESPKDRQEKVEKSVKTGRKKVWENKKEQKSSYNKPVEEELQEEEETPIVFDDDEYDDIILGSPRKKKSSLYGLVMVVFIAFIIALYFYTK